MKPCILIISAGYVAGVPHRAPNLTQAKVTDPLDLEPEPSNPYDPNAIKIIHRATTQFLGYVPREQCKGILVAQQAGFATSAFIVGLLPTKWKEVEFNVFIEAGLLPTSGAHHSIEEAK